MYAPLVFLFAVYNLSGKAMQTILKRYSKVVAGAGPPKSLIAFDDFVALSVRLRAYTGKIPLYQILLLT